MKRKTPISAINFEGGNESMREVSHKYMENTELCVTQQFISRNVVLLFSLFSLTVSLTVPEEQIHANR